MERIYTEQSKEGESMSEKNCDCNCRNCENKICVKVKGGN